MTYYTPQRRRLSLLQIPITIIAIFCLFGWVSERDYAYQMEVAELHQTLAALDAECTPVIELSMPVDMGLIQL